MNYKNFSKAVLCATLTTTGAQAQLFSTVGAGTDNAILCMYADSATNILYVGGEFSQAGSTNCAYIASWNGTDWDSTNNQLGFGTNDYVRTIEKFNGQIYIGGDIAWVDTSGNIVITFAASWDSSIGAWINFGANANERVNSLYSYNNSLYIAGTFDTIGGIYSPKIVRYDGANWYALPPLDTNGGGWAFDCSFFYNGDLYIGGNFLGTAGPNMRDIARWNGTQWIPVGNGMSGAITWVLDFTVYQGKLIVAGRFRTSTGDPGNSIAAWDGTQWTQLGTGMTTGEVKSVIVYNGELWAGGAFYDAGGIPVTHLAKWDGTQWQSLGITLDNAVTSFAVLGNDLYIAGAFSTMDGASVNHIIRYNPSTGFQTLEPKENKTEVYPNPAQDVINIRSTINFPATEIIFYDASCRAVMEKKFSKNTSFSVKELNEGIYFYKIKDAKGKEERGKIVKE